MNLLLETDLCFISHGIMVQLLAQFIYLFFVLKKQHVEIMQMSQNSLGLWI